MIQQFVRIWICGALTISVVVSSGGASPDRSAVERLAESVGFRQFTVQSLQPIENDESMTIPLQIDGKSCSAVLYPFSVRAPSFRVRAIDASGAARELPVPPVTSFRGHLEGELEGEIVAGIREGKIEATIRTSDTPDDQWVIRPVEGVEGFSAADHIVYRGIDAPSDSGTCGVQSTPKSSGDIPVPPASIEVPMSVRMCEIACDTDVEFYTACGSNPDTVTATIEQIINGVSKIYELDAQVAFEITEIIIRSEEPDPYTSTNPTTFLAEMRDYWNANLSGVHRDTAHLFTGKNLGNTNGIAYTDTVCYNDAYGLTWPFRSGYALDKRIAIAAHEIAHNFDAAHCDYDVQCRLMCPSMENCSGGYHSFEPSGIAAIRAARSRYCLSDDSVVWNSLLPPLTDDFSYAQGWVSKVPDVTKWVEVDRAEAILSRLEIEMSKGYDGFLRCGTLRTLPMKIDRPTKISMRVCPNAIRNPWSLLIEYLDNTFRWKTLATIVSPNESGQSTSTYTPYEWIVPADGYGNFFAVRLTGYGTNPNLTSSNWRVDDVRIEWIDTDFNHDGRVDLADFALFASVWLTHEGDPAWNSAFDLQPSTDKAIDLNDLKIWLENWLRIL